MTRTREATQQSLRRSYLVFALGRSKSLDLRARKNVIMSDCVFSVSVSM